MKYVYAALLGVVCFVGGPVRADAPAGPPEAYIPAEWLKAGIDWKPTWDETLKANTLQKFQADLTKDNALKGLADRIAPLHRVEMIKAAMLRWPDRANRIAGYAEIARTFQQAGSNYWRSYWGWKMVQDFPDDAAAVTQGYQLMLGWSFGQYTHWGWYGYLVAPECRDFEFAIGEIIARHKAGKLGEDSPAVATAYSYLGWEAFDLWNYGAYYTLLGRADKSRSMIVDESQISYLGLSQAPAAGGDVMFDLNDRGQSQLDEELRTRWEAAQHSEMFGSDASSLRPDEVQVLLDLAAASGAHVRQGGNYVPFWVVIDQHLLGLGHARLAPLAAAHELAARSRAAAAGVSGDVNDLIAAFRRYPFAPSLHRLMVELAEKDVRAGNWVRAVALVRDVIKHSADAALTRQAHAVLWLALAQQSGNRGELATAMSGLSDEATVPWRGAEEPAAKVKAALLSQMDVLETQRAVRLAGLKVRRVQLPPEWPSRQWNLDGPIADRGSHAPWPVSQVEVAGESVLVSHPGAIARFDANSPQAAWTHILPPQPLMTPWWNEATARYMAATMWMQRLMVRRAVRTSAGKDLQPRGALYYLMTPSIPAYIQAVDAGKGTELWSTRGRDTWEDLTPMSRPTLAGGRLYVLAGPAKMDTLFAVRESPNTPLPTSLVCLDAQDGRVLWRRSTGWIENTHLDLARGSAAVLVHQGRVYCCNNMGIMSCFDAYDGLTVWVRPYPPAVQRLGGYESLNLVREGTCPIITPMPAALGAGDMLLAAPRDHTGVIAFNSQNGKLLWQTPLAPSDRIVGVSGSVVIGISQYWLTALDITGGRQLYCREFPAGTGGQAALIGGDVVLASGGKLYRIQASTGNTLEETDLQTAGNEEPVICPDGTIVLVAAPPLPAAKAPPTAGREIKLPLKQVWSLACESPAVLFGDTIGAADDSFGFVSGRRIGMVRSKPGWELTWDKLLPLPPQGAAKAGGRLLTSMMWTLDAHGGADGKALWSTKLGLLPFVIGGDDKTVYAGGRGWGGYFATLDGATGKVIWSGNPGWDPRVGIDQFQRSRLQREGDGSATLRCMGNVSDAAGSGAGEIVLDAATGRAKSLRPLLVPGTGSWSPPNWDTSGLAYIVSKWPKGKVAAFGHDGATDVAAKWQRELNLEDHRWHYRLFGAHYRDGKIYVRLAGQMLVWDPATGKELALDMTRGGGVIEPFIFAFKQIGNRIIVVNGFTNQRPAAPGKHSPEATKPDQWRMFVDIFDATTGQPQGRQELPGVLCCISLIAYQEIAGYDSQVQILDGSIVITDINGIHVFASE
ncbi:MAG: PQQ-like beta-propeller repeat protein [Planctomycetaceae bacterium]|nr:PQQ-like beta-propeller repeat protein [Planctomycetaceae bacterium]